MSSVGAVNAFAVAAAAARAVAARAVAARAVAARAVSTRTVSGGAGARIGGWRDFATAVDRDIVRAELDPVRIAAVRARHAALIVIDDDRALALGAVAVGYR